MRRIVQSLLSASLALGALSGCSSGGGGGGGDDDTPPEVESTDPANGATGVSVLAAVTATFTEDMDESTVTTETFRLSLATGGDLVTGAVAAVDPDTFTFTPAGALDAGTTYLVQIFPEVTDASGNELESSYTWSFTTTTSDEFVFSSSAIVPGGMIPEVYTCADANFSPPLEWSGAPEGVQSWAVVFTDTDFLDLRHWVIWDIPLATASLEFAIPTDPQPNPPGGGAKQTRSYDDATYGYLGPCPEGNLHTYEFRLHAIDVTTLPDVSTSDASEDVVTVIEAQSLVSRAFTADSDALSP